MNIVVNNFSHVLLYHHYANGISIASAVFAGLTRCQTDRQTDRPGYSVGNNRQHLRT